MCSSKPRSAATSACSPAAAQSATPGSSSTSASPPTTAAGTAAALDRARLRRLGQLSLYPLRDLGGRHEQELEPSGLAAMARDEDDEHARPQLEAGLEWMLAEPKDERGREQLAQDQVVLRFVRTQVVALGEDG